jgi:Restriction endonuclease NaeI
MGFGVPSIGEAHPDFPVLSRIRSSIFSHARGKERLLTQFPLLLQDAIDFDLDPVHTARRAVKELDNVEKTFIGLKVEHYIRDFLDVPKGLRDLRIDGMDVDVKNTVGGSWMIPPETYRDEEPCLLIAIADDDRKCWLGLMLARNEYLGKAEGNRDAKRTVIKNGRDNILWMIEGTELPASRWVNVDMERFRILRSMKGGTKRAATFFRENIGLVVHRTIIEALLHDQLDYMKRLRGNGGARDLLKAEGVDLLSGAYDRHKIDNAMLGTISREEFVAVRRSND